MFTTKDDAATEYWKQLYSAQKASLLWLKWFEHTSPTNVSLCILSSSSYSDVCLMFEHIFSDNNLPHMTETGAEQS